MAGEDKMNGKRLSIMVTMTGKGYPIGGRKPDEHHDLPSGKQVIGFAIALLVVIATAIIIVNSGTTSAENGQPPPIDKGIPTPVPTTTAKVTPTPTVTATATATTDWQKQLEIDRKDPILGKRINKYPILLPINKLPKEIKVAESLYVIDLNVGADKTITGYLSYQGSTSSIEIKGGTITLIAPNDYTSTGPVSLEEFESYTNSNSYTNIGYYIFLPGEKKSFTLNPPKLNSNNMEAIQKYKNSAWISLDFHYIKHNE